MFKIIRKRNCTAPLFQWSRVVDGFEVGCFRFSAAFCLSDTCNSLGAHWNGIGVLCDYTSPFIETQSLFSQIQNSETTSTCLFSSVIVCSVVVAVGARNNLTVKSDDTSASD